MATECELCRLYEKREIVTRLYFEDPTCIVVDCKTHRVPMCVLKRHTASPTREELDHLNRVARVLFPARRFRGPASIRQHYHLHQE
jgi:hypothetical protein